MLEWKVWLLSSMLGHKSRWAMRYMLSIKKLQERLQDLTAGLLLPSDFQCAPSSGRKTRLKTGDCHLAFELWEVYRLSDLKQELWYASCQAILPGSSNEPCCPGRHLIGDGSRCWVYKTHTHTHTQKGVSCVSVWLSFLHTVPLLGQGGATQKSIACNDRLMLGIGGAPKSAGETSIRKVQSRPNAWLCTAQFSMPIHWQAGVWKGFHSTIGAENITS